MLRGFVGYCQSQLIKPVDKMALSPASLICFMKKLILASILCLVAVAISLPSAFASDDVCKDCKDKSCKKGYSCYVKDGDGKCKSNKKPPSGYTRCWKNGKKVNCNPCKEEKCRSKKEECYVNSKGSTSCLRPKGVNTKVHAVCPTEYVEEGEICIGCEGKSCDKGHSCYARNGKGSCKSNKKPPSGYTRCWSSAEPIDCTKCYSKKCSNRDQKCYVKSDGSASCKKSKGVDSKKYAECQTQYKEGEGDPKLKKDYESAKRAKSKAWKNYKRVNKDKYNDYKKKKKAAWMVYIRAKDKESASLDAIKKSARSRYKDKKLRAREKYLKIKTSYKTTYNNLKKEYEIAEKTYKKCKKMKGVSKCKKSDKEYKDLKKKKNAAFTKYKKKRDKAKKKYESVKRPAKKKYDRTIKKAKRTYKYARRALKVTYEETKSADLAEYKKATKPYNKIYKNLKKDYEAAKARYETSKKQ